MHIEHITLQPHPLETFRQALNALVVCAPGSRGDIAAHLYDAARTTGDGEPLTQPTPLQRRLCEQLLSAMADEHWLDVPAHDAAQVEPGRKTA
ncbi:MAG: hypothetical protein H7A12_16485 [Pseudomonadales bacterium]|jgi:hypothetical protein|nr:hypothetical protein [Pseudomonadales bacterium]